FYYICFLLPFVILAIIPLYIVLQTYSYLLSFQLIYQTPCTPFLSTNQSRKVPSYSPYCFILLLYMYTLIRFLGHSLNKILFLFLFPFYFYIYIYIQINSFLINYFHFSNVYFYIFFFVFFFIF